MGSATPVDNKMVLANSKALRNSPPEATSDSLDPAAVAARQRASQRMADGMNSTFGTSTRGLQGAPGAGVKGPPNGGDDEPIITSMTGREHELSGLSLREPRDPDAPDDLDLIAKEPGATPGPVHSGVIHRVTTAARHGARTRRVI